MADTPQASDPDKGLSDVWAFDPDALHETFVRIARLAQTLARAPVARVALEDGARIWTVGAEPPPNPLTNPIPVNRETLAGLLIRDGKSRWIEDTLLDPTTRDSPFVTGEAPLRFAAGAPIVMSNGQSIGGLYIGDHQPRAYDAEVADRLEDLAELVAQACERPRLQKALAQASADAAAAVRMMSSFVESSPLALLMTDRDFRILHVSPQWRLDMGMVGVDVTGQTIFDVFPESRRRLGEIFVRGMAGETVRLDRVRLNLPNGERPWVRSEVTAWRDGRGEIGGLLCMTHDITEMVQALEDSERTRQRLKLAVGIADVHVYEMDFVGRTLFKEGSSDSFFEVPPTYDSLKRDIWSVVHADDVEAAKATWARCQAEGLPYRTEYRLHPVNGRDVWTFAGSEVVYGADGQVNRVIGVLQNITARKEAQFAVVQARDAAQTANRAKSEFLANMSHEIRTPLNGVMGVAGALSRTALSPDQQDMVRLIENSAQTLESLLSDVLDLARIESGRLALKVEPFSLDDAVRPVAALFEPNARAKGLEFRVEVSPEAQGAFSGDIARIRQILSNLISNAVKFTAEGAVRVSVEAEASGETASLLHFNVTDSGIGFDAEAGRRLFERFEQADGSITRRFGGSGLGLAISRSLAEEMGGSLTATATPGKGASFTFSVELPRRARAGAERNLTPWATAEAQGAPGSVLRVLLAEDHPTNRRVVELVLGAIGVSLTSVENGQEAVDAFASQSFDLILMDMQMPVMDGLTAIRAIRAQEAAEQRPYTPIYTLTANAMAEHAEAAREAGADAHLTKPISAETLIEAVRQVDQKAAEPALRQSA
jgi:PAS domain S-box-containing protein